MVEGKPAAAIMGPSFAPRWLPLLLLALTAAPAAALVETPQHHRLRTLSLEGAKVGEPRLPHATVLAEQAPSSTQSTSWFQRLQDSLTDFVVGIVLIIFSVPVLWVNESRAAQMESLISFGKSEARSVGKGPADAKNDCWLVHVGGQEARAAAPVADDQFDVLLQDNCIRLQRKVEVYQIIEVQKKEEREKFGGGKETTTVYTYREEWSEVFHDSGNYFQTDKRRNTKPAGLIVGSHCQDCSRVELGEAYVLSPELVEQCTDFQSAHDRLRGALRLTVGAGTEFKKSGEFYYYRAKGTQSLGGGDQVGDARVSFRYVPNHSATVLALQRPCESGRASFLPYRTINRGWFGLSEELAKERLFEQGRKSAGDLASEASFGGIFACLCCALNLVNMCFRSVLSPEIHHLFAGDRSVDKCFETIAGRSTALKWGIRVAGWLMMFVGLYALFSPLLTFIKVIPFLGPLVASLGGAFIWFLCLITTLAAASAIVVVAYLFYHPLLALLYAAVSAAAVGGVYLLAGALHA